MQRIVSLLPAATEIAAALGLIEQVVGISHECDFPAAANDRPRVTRSPIDGAGDGTGVGLVEVYDIDQTADSELANVSTRGFVQTGDNVMIGGFILGGNEVQTSDVVVRAIGPSRQMRELPIRSKIQLSSCMIKTGW